MVSASTGGEQESLGLMASHRHQHLRGGVGLQPHRDQFQTECLSEGDDGPDDGQIVLAPVEVLHE